MIKLTSIIFLFTITNLSHANEPKEALATFYTALVNGDTAKATEQLAPEVAIYESGFVERSRAAYTAHHLAGDIAFAKTSTSSVLQHSERIDGNLAVIWEETETKTKTNGKSIRILGTETAVLQKNGDNWYIVHVHWSSRKTK